MSNRRYERKKPVKNCRQNTRYRMFLQSCPGERKVFWTSRESYRARAGDTVDGLHKQAINTTLGAGRLIVSARHDVGVNSTVRVN